MSLIIGILGRPKKADKDITSFSKAITDVIIDNNAIPLGLIAPTKDVANKMMRNEIEKLYEVINLCDGFILQGGTDYYQYDIEAIKYICKKNIPLLGICLGMQSLGVAFGGTLDFIIDHNKGELEYAHLITIDKRSKLYKIIGTEKIAVNSRHNEVLTNPGSLKIVGTADDKIEAIANESALFMLGVQWHPEDLLCDKNSKKIFDAFFNACQTYNKKR
jgi:gamma-glutamyl-gamma-aminobutyrate hydrolase PuuD